MRNKIDAMLNKVETTIYRYNSTHSIELKKKLYIDIENQWNLVKKQFLPTRLIANGR